MRFQRHAKIFRGQLDAAPIASVFFLLIVFLMLGNLLYTPGVLVKLAGDPVVISKTGRISYGGKEYSATNLQELRADLKSSTGTGVDLRSEPGAPAAVVDQVHKLFSIDLPPGTGLVGTANPTIIVAVNLRGQLFFENRQIDESELKTELESAAKNVRENSKELTLVLLADKLVENEVWVRLSNLARS